MKKLKTQKGITLIALIITIVVLLILAGVAIGTLKESNIIGHAQNAAGSFNQAKNNEVDELAKYEAELDKYTTGEKIEYLGDLRLNKAYIFAGKDTSMSLKFYSNGNVDVISELGNSTEQYTLKGDLVKVAGWEFEVIREEKNDILIYSSVIETGIQPTLLATSTEGLEFFDSEKYVSEEGYITTIILTNDKVEELRQGTQYTIPVFYKGNFYNFIIHISETEEVRVISTDNCETLNVNGIIYTKSTE